MVYSLYNRCSQNFLQSESSGRQRRPINFQDFLDRQSHIQADYLLSSLKAPVFGENLGQAPGDGVRRIIITHNAPRDMADPAANITYIN